MQHTEKIIELWLKSKELYVKKSTLAQYRRTVYKTLVDEYKVSNISCFNNKNQQDLVEWLVKAYGSKTVRNTLTLLNQFFDFAYERKFIKSRINLSIKMPLPQTPKVQILNMFEQKALTNYLITDLDYSKLGVLICLYTGLRLGEICGLQWNDFNLNYNTISVRKTVQRISTGSGSTYFLISSPKTQNSEREIPMPDFLIKFLKQSHFPLNENVYIATGTNMFMQPRTYQNRLKSYFKKCGLPDYHFHTLRHTFASRAVELGFDIKALSEVLGHASTKITLDLYVHPSMELKKKEMQKLSALI